MGFHGSGVERAGKLVILSYPGIFFKKEERIPKVTRRAHREPSDEFAFFPKNMAMIE